MKKYATIQAEIARNAETIRKESERLDALTWTEKDADNGAKIAERLDALKLENAILTDNARRAYIAEVLSKLLEIWNRNAGKAYGPKTKEKIRDEVRAACGCSFYVETSQFSDPRVIHISPLDKDGYTVPGYYGKFDLYTTRENCFINGNNKIQAVAPDSLTLGDCGEYVENVAERAQEIREKWHAMQDAAKKLNEMIAEFNTIRASNIKRVDKVYNVPNYLLSI